MKENLLSHKRSYTILICAMLVLFGCCTFPIYNFSKEGPGYFRILNLLIACAAYGQIGKFEKILLPKKGRAAAFNLGLTAVGLACRFLLEFGEVSNIYNFTVPNVALHLLAVVLIPLFSSI